MTFQADSYLLITHSADFYTIDRVEAALHRRGARPLRFNSDEFPEKSRLNLQPGGTCELVLPGSGCIPANRIAGVWLRRLWPAKFTCEVDPRYVPGAVNESMETVLSFLSCLDSVQWINSMHSSQIADNKLRQLNRAQELGIRIPRTLISNDAEQVRAFYRQVRESGMVSKLLTALVQSMEATDFFLYTNDVREEDLAELSALQYGPMVFQEKIEKLKELRIIYVAGRFFCGAVDTRASLSGQTDWRRSKQGECPWEYAELPAFLEQSLDAFMRSFGLLYGAIDVILTPGGEYVFLEVNTAGEWGMIERDLGHDISGAIADALIGPKQQAIG